MRLSAFYPLCLAGLLAAGCTSLPRQIMAPATTAPAKTVNRQQVQADLMNFVDDLITAVHDSYGKVIDSPNSPAKIAFAADQRLDIAASALDDAVNANPLTGLMDVVVLTTLSRQAIEQPAARITLGSDYTAVHDMLRGQEAAAWGIAGKYLSPQQQNELKNEIHKWTSANPDQRFVTHVKLVDFAASADGHPTDVQAPDSIFSLLFLDPLSDIDPAVREIAQARDIAERLFFYGQHTPLILSWRVQSMYQKMLDVPQVTSLQANINSIDTTGKRITEIADRLTTIIEKLPTDKWVAIEQMRSNTVDASDAILRQATTRMSAEREVTLQQLSEVMLKQQKVASDNANAVIAQSMAQFRRLMLETVAWATGAVLLALVVHRLLMIRR